MPVPPSTIVGLGPVDVAPLLNREWDPTGLDLTPHDYFVLTRCDGKTTFRMILQMTGFPEPQTIGILQKLREEGAILLPGEAPPLRKLRTQPAATAPQLRPRAAPVLDEAILAEECDLTPEQKRAILGKFISLQGATLFDVLDLGPDAEKKTLKRAYFKISKDFHPDRFYGKNLGSYQARLATIFKAATDAFEILDDDARRAAYIERLTAREQGSAAGPAPAPKAQSQAEHAAALFERACQNEVMGQTEQALKEFAAAVRLDPHGGPQGRYFKRAALACLRAQELRSAEEYATKAAEIDPRDATVHRTLAKVFRAVGRTQDALREIEVASNLDPDNQHIATELDELRRQQP